MPKKSRDASFAVKSVILCDDIREERSGKEILIGVYRDAAIFPNFPAGFLRLWVRVNVLVTKNNPKQIRLKVVDDEGREVFNLDSEAPNFAIDQVANVRFAVQNLGFTRETVLSIFFGIDEEIELIETFTIRLPTNEQERSNLQAAS